jgi:Restriction Endonuclease associating with ARP
VPPDVTEYFVGGTHARRLADNLLPGLSQRQLAVLRAQLMLGAGGELRVTRNGKRPAHAPYSSAALAVSAFGRWLGFEADLRVAGLGGFAEPLVVESRQQIRWGGGQANLDCLLRAPGITVGVESKLTETLREHGPTAWAAVFGDPRMTELLPGAWGEVFHASRTGTWPPAHLGLEQLLKHALALRSRFPDDECHLVYVWWEPENADEIPEVLTHRREVAKLRDLVGDGQPLLHALTYADLLAEWAALPSPPCLPEHLAELHARYAVAI